MQVVMQRGGFHEPRDILGTLSLVLISLMRGCCHEWPPGTLCRNGRH